MRLKFASVVLGFASLTTSCGSEYNFNQLWGKDDDRVDSVLSEARVAYDQGDFARAEKLGKKAYAINPDNEQAVILLGYVNLSKGGVDPFLLARNLYEASDDSVTSLQGNNLLQAKSNSNDFAELLSTLGDIVNLSAADQAKLGSLYKDGEGLYFNTADGTELVVPSEVTDELRAQIPTLSAMSEAMRYICPFVDQDVESSLFNPDLDTRHVCGKTAQTRKFSAKAHFLWAFTHLTEALVYQTVLLKTSAATEGAAENKSALQAGAEKLNSSDIAGLANLIEGINEINEAVSSVFQFDNPNSQINVTIRNLEVVEAAFAKLAGLPSSFTGSITKNLDKVRQIGQDIGGEETPESGETGTAKALKGQMTGKAVDQVYTKINAEYAKVLQASGGNPEAISAEQQAQIAEVCAAYDELSVGVDPSKKKTPNGC